MKKPTITSLASLLGASSSALAIFNGPDLNVGITTYTDSDFATWTLDGNETNFIISRTLSTSDSATYTNVFASGYISIYRSTGSLEFVTTGGKIKLLATGDPLSDGAGLNFKRSFFPAVGVSYSATAGLTAAESEAAEAVASDLMLAVFGASSGTNHIIGFRFEGGSGNYYGWALASWSGMADDFSMSFTDVTYSDTEGILAGTTTAIPEAETAAVGLGALALGAAGLYRWRKRKAA